MKDIPVFATECGVASLLLKEIPYRQEAYIRIQDVQPGQTEALLKECAAFCRMAGAERIYAAGKGELDGYPLHASVLEMQADAAVDPELLVNLFPVTERTVGLWRQIYNERMAAVDNAGTLTALEEKRILTSGGAYFVHRAGALLGIGWLEENRLLAIASVKPGAGKTVANTLFSLAQGARIVLEVASTNEKAIRLYESLGFLVTGEICRWYRI